MKKDTVSAVFRSMAFPLFGPISSVVARTAELTTYSAKSFYAI